MIENNNVGVRDEKPISFEEALSRTGNGLYNIALASTCALILLAMGSDLFGFSLVVTAACDLQLTMIQKGILNSLPYVGILLVSYAWGYISDTRGRKLTLSISLKASFLLSCLASLSPNWIVLAVIKFFSVCFSCASNSAAYTLMGETCVQRVRSKYMLLMTSLLILSPAVASLIALPIMKLAIAPYIPLLNIHFSPWRLLCVVLALPLGMGALAIHFFHESPKFLANKGRNDEALEVLKSIYCINNRCSASSYKTISIEKLSNETAKRGFIRNLYEQSAPLFRPPLLKQTLQLFYMVGIIYVTNNSFLVWLPHIINELRASLKAGQTTGTICQLITTPVPVAATFNSTSEEFEDISTATTTLLPLCRGIDDNAIFTLMAAQITYSFLNFVISHLPNKRRAVLITILMISALSGLLVNLIPDPITSSVIFVMFTCTCLGMGIMASYFVDLYPTSYRGMVACLSIMVGRSSTFVGINVVGNLLFSHCDATFYVFSLLVLSSAVAAWFLPEDKQPINEITKL